MKFVAATFLGRRKIIFLIVSSFAFANKLWEFLFRAALFTNHFLLIVTRFHKFLVILFAAYVAAKPAKDTCQKSCGSDYTPVCGKPAEGKGTNILFGNSCVLSNYNCEKKDKRKEISIETSRLKYFFVNSQSLPVLAYVKTADNECNDKTPVRL